MSATASLAEFIVDARPTDLPAWTYHEAKRTLVNLLGVPAMAWGRGRRGRGRRP